MLSIKKSNEQLFRRELPDSRPFLWIQNETEDKRIPRKKTEKHKLGHFILLLLWAWFKKFSTGKFIFLSSEQSLPSPRVYQVLILRYHFRALKASRPSLGVEIQFQSSYSPLLLEPSTETRARKSQKIGEEQDFPWFNTKSLVAQRHGHGVCQRFQRSWQCVNKLLRTRWWHRFLKLWAFYKRHHLNHMSDETSDSPPISQLAVVLAINGRTLTTFTPTQS